VEKKTPIVALHGARSFFCNELGPRKIRRLQNVEGPKNSKTPSLSLLSKND
jgi:hypothetical protein